MREATHTIANAIQTTSKGFRRPNWLIDAEPYSRTTDSPAGFDDLKLKAAVKRAVERDLAPQTLIDALKNKIRNTNEPR
jgi:hypothetical protein